MKAGTSMEVCLYNIRGYDKVENYPKYILIGSAISKTLEKHNKPFSVLSNIVESYENIEEVIGYFFSEYQEEGIGEVVGQLIKQLDKDACRIFFKEWNGRTTGTFAGVYDLFVQVAWTDGYRGSIKIPRSMQGLFEKEMIKDSIKKIYFPMAQGDPLWPLVVADRYSNMTVYMDTTSLDVYNMVKVAAYAYDISNVVCKQGELLKGPTFVCEDGTLQQFDCVISILPVTSRNQSSEEGDKFGRFPFGRPSKRDATLDYLSHALASTKEGGRALVLTLGGPLFRGGIEAAVRKALVKSGQVEGVIKFAGFILASTGASPYALLLHRSLKKSPSVRMIDASDIVGIQGRAKILGSSHMEQILSLYHSEDLVNGVATSVSIEDIVHHDGELIPDSYTTSTNIRIPMIGEKVLNKDMMMDHKHTVELGIVADFINGINLKSTGEKHSIYLIKASDIKDGKLVRDELEVVLVDNLLAIQKAKVQAGDILLLSRGSSIKFAVMPEGIEDAYASVNLMIVRPKEGVDPYFIQAFLESPFGIWQLEQIQSGTTIKLIKLQDIKGIRLPKLTEEMQAEIGKQHRLTHQKYEEEMKAAYQAKMESTLHLYEQLGVMNWVK